MCVSSSLTCLYWQKDGKAIQEWTVKLQRVAWCSWTDTDVARGLLCRELWHRASLAWTQLLEDASDSSSMLIVAHNAVNQVTHKVWAKCMAVATYQKPCHYLRMFYP